MHTLLLPLFLLAFGGKLAFSQGGHANIPDTFPHAWPNQPSEPFSPEWQSYFEVTKELPDIPGPLPRMFAGNIPVNRQDHPNDTLFFWGFEKQGANGSLTAPADQNNADPWIIWLQGGPGSSSMVGLTIENGPIRILANGTWMLNNYSWNNFADMIWVDQPVGTGFSTADSTGYIADEDQMGEDFLGFLSNLVSVFPSLATRPLYLTGESYAGTFIPYIAKHIFQTENPPVKLRKLTIGDGWLGSEAGVLDVSVVNVIETYPALIGYDQDVFAYFQEQSHLCGFDLNLTYPQHGNFPTLKPPPSPKSVIRRQARKQTASFRRSVAEKFVTTHGINGLGKREEFLARREASHSQWKRDLAGRANGTIDHWYGCSLLDELGDYAANFTFPWSKGVFDEYDIPDATDPSPSFDPSDFLNDNHTRAAIHAPTSKDWVRDFDYPFGNSHTPTTDNPMGDPSVEPMAFLSELAANASAANVSIVFYSGNDDALIQHHGTEVIIQNMTFGGVQGFTRKPSTPWYDDDGNVAGIVHQERGITYVLIAGAGHLVPEWKPAQSFVFMREFVFGSNMNGTVSGTTIEGGEDAALANDDFLPGGTAIFYGSKATQGTSTIPAATQSAWSEFLATATATQSPIEAKNGARGHVLGDILAVIAGFAVALSYILQ
ncbi:alpha/beta-hydrolase [Pilatotrama ljubarskyi]|nr:alpha/beta-hydrolase [Pilatotrama ljubarskyi]